MSRSNGAAPASEAPKEKRKKSRSRPVQSSLRQVAVEAQMSRDGLLPRSAISQGQPQTKRVRAYCVAEQFDLPTVVKILQARGFQIDPRRTSLYPQVVHVEFSRSAWTRTHNGNAPPGPHDNGDTFIFPSGTVVAWNVPEGFASTLVESILAPAARGPHFDQIETEDLDYIEDDTKEYCTIKGDTIVVGTNAPMNGQAGGPNVGPRDRLTQEDEKASSAENSALKDSKVNEVLVKIAFSSGLARSTKLAVLETLLSNYFESTRSIPTLLSKGSRLPFTRSVILRKTGQLLSLRAQLNLYSELTDSLPDIFWDSRHELGLEGYYEQVGRALDVGIRIKVLNTKMDYAQEIASVLRERLSEKHGLTLEWMIIVLIAVEVAFEVLRLVKERNGQSEPRRSTAGGA